MNLNKDIELHLMEKKDIIGGKFIIEYDEQRKCLVLSTSTNKTIEIGDDGASVRLSDQHNNEIVMDEKGISLSSGKDITLKAKGNIILNAVKNAGVTAKADVSIEGLNVKVKANVGVIVNGTASAELSASGQTVVKGAMVMIN